MGKNFHATECATGCGDLCYYGAVICLECEALTMDSSQPTDRA